MARVVFTDPAVRDLESLDGSVLGLVLKKILRLESEPAAGYPLGSRAGTNLTGYRKVVVGNRDWRIIYRTEDDDTVVVVWVIAARTDDECYAEAAKRISDSDQVKKLEMLDVIEQLRGSKARKVERIFFPER